MNLKENKRGEFKKQNRWEKQKANSILDNFHSDIIIT